MKIRSRFLIRMATWCLRLVFLAIFATTRKKLVTAVPDISPFADTKGVNYLYCIWHDEIVGAIFSGPTAAVEASGTSGRSTDVSIVRNVPVEGPDLREPGP